jgi:N-methylhydantoinase B
LAGGPLIGLDDRMERQDLITVEIIRNYLEAVSQEISATVENTAMSPIFSLTHDYSCGVTYWDGQDVHLVARDLSLPVHIFAAIDSVRMIFDCFKGDINEGDVFLVADPYMGGSHCPDWTVIKPVVFDGHPMLQTCVRGHVIDVGGPVPGNYYPGAREVWQEGFRVPPIRLVSQGQPVRDLWEVVLANTRLPEDVRGDLRAMVGACTVGERRLGEAVAKYGLAAVKASINYMLEYSEVQLRSQISGWPDGTVEHTEFVDHDFAGNDDIPIRVSVTVRGDSLVLDFTGTSAQVPGFINSPPGNTLSQVLTPITSLCPEIPVNSGFFRPIEVVLPEGSILNPEPPAPVGHCTLCPGTTVIDAVMKAFEQVIPELVGSSTADMHSARCFGRNTGTGKFWVAPDMSATPMSAGAAYQTDGWGAWSSPFCALRLPPQEDYEARYPYLYLLSEYSIDTAAPGQWRGAPSFHYRRRNLDEMRCSVYNSGYRHSLSGFLGGKRGAGNYWILRERSPDELAVTDACYAEVLPKGSLLFAQSGARGAWGDPLDRDPILVLEDWLEEIVSLDGARRDYGVVIDPEKFAVDENAQLATGCSQGRHRL